ncbi:iron-containing alcohol dehydrogenase [Blastopirellula marina]|uniref:Putative iron alcohol dehydrogenase n=1 Tax=Blastopirellula marina DSM 3645 TaxID=314230 RepID=A3ZZU0_9BACT|nr:iron-containing alcohol dehydrogenase [Blastopirellula marina]EAQ78050.1 putative iron alcohol dehydrogenase [Blastopirellula marina DSM 3645]
MIPFDFQPRTRIVFGPGVVAQLGVLAVEQGAKRVLVVSDPGVVKAGHSQTGIDSLTAAGLETVLFDGVQENPTTANVDAGVAMAKETGAQLIVGLGGGSAMDCAKGINFLLSNGGQMQDYWGVGKATREMLPMIAVPTTAGTGSETQSFALISDAETHVKMACGDPKASCKIALLDPELTVTQPQRVTALTGIDAIAHALETFVTRRRNSCSLAFSRGAWRMLASNYAQVLKDPTNLEARGGMQLGACFAGLAIENSMLGAAHALANPLTSMFGVVHGQAVAVMLPHVIRYNSQLVGDWYRELLQVDVPIEGFPSGDHPAALADFVTQLVSQADLATDLTSLGVDPDSTTQLGVDAAKQWTGTFNPREVDAASLKSLYDAAM